MSGSGQPPLADSEKVDVRRYCGYPAYGSGPSDDTFNRFDPAFETLEYRMSSLQDAELIVCRSKLVQLTTLDTGIVSMSGTLGISMAGPFERNSNESGDRGGLYRERRVDLCQFLGVPLGPALQASRRSVAMVV